MTIILDSVRILAHKLSTVSLYSVSVYTFHNRPSIDLLAKILSTDLTHEDVKYPCGNGQRKGCEENSEKPGGRIHGGMKALSLEVHVQLWELFLRGENRGLTFALPLSLPISNGIGRKVLPGS